MENYRKVAYPFENCSVLVLETLTIKEATITAFQYGMLMIIAESDSHMTIRSIFGQSQAQKHIRDSGEDINIYVHDFRDI